MNVLVIPEDFRKDQYVLEPLRDDLKSGELSLAIFAADLYDVMMGKARPVYQQPQEFFALTYPTFNLRELARDVVVRLAGKSDKAIRQLELSEGEATMKLSYTALKTFQQCHFRYHLRYDRGLASRPRPAAQSSRALHGALHLFHQGLKNQQAGKDALSPPAMVG